MAREILIRIDDDLCQACPDCQAACICIVRAIVTIDPGEPPYLDVSRCYDCRLCIQACPHGAIFVGNGQYFPQS